MKTTIELPEEVLQRAKIAAIQRKTTLKELICQSLLRELNEHVQAKTGPNELADAFSRGSNTNAPVGRLHREELHTRENSPPTQTPVEGELPYYRHPKTGFLVSRTLNTPGFMPPTAEDSLAMIERANEEEDLRRVGLLR